MSTKIYNGRRLEGGIAKVYDLLMDAKPQVAAIARELQVAWLARRAVEMIDDAQQKGEAIDMPLHRAWLDLLDKKAEIEKEKRRHPADFDLEIWLFPRPGRTTLAIVNTMQGEFEKWFDGLPFVTDFGYWDNTDRPDDVTAQEWGRRRRAWGKALPGLGIAAERCLTLSLVNGSWIEPADPNEAMRHVPSRERRIDRLTEIRHIDEHYRAAVDEKRREDPDYVPRDLSPYYEARRTAKVDTARRAEIAAEIGSMLQKVTPSLLRGEAARR